MASDEPSTKRPRLSVESNGQAEIDALCAWATAYTAPEIPASKLRMEAKDGVRFVYSTEPIETGTEFASIPWKIVITSRVARESETGKAISTLEADLRSQDTNHKPFPGQLYLFMFLIGEKAKGNQSFWAPYLNSLPKKFHDTLWFTPSELALLTGTNLEAACAEETSRLQNMYNLIFPAMWERKEGRIFSKEHFTLAELRWARSAYSSRGFPAGIVKGQGQDDDCGCLLPYLDMLNHRYGTPITWVAYPERVAFRTEANIAAGQEVFNNYGPKGNEECLHGYGFCTENNPSDKVIVKLTMNEQRLDVDRLALLTAFSAQTGQRWQDHFLYQDYLSVSLLSVLRICVATAEELKELKFKLPQQEQVAHPKDESSAIYLNATNIRPGTEAQIVSEWLPLINHRNEIQVAENLTRLIKTRLDRLQETTPTETPQGAEYNSEHVANIMIYRHGQEKVLKSSLKLAADFLKQSLKAALLAHPLPPPAARPRVWHENPTYFSPCVVLQNGIPMLTDAIEAEHVVAWFPQEQLMTIAHPVAEAVIEAVSELTDGLEEDNLLQLFVFSEMGKGVDSVWHRFLTHIPPGANSIWLDVENSNELEHPSDAILEMRDKFEQLQQIYEALFPTLAEIAPQLFDVEYSTWPNFLLAAAIVQGWGHMVELDGREAVVILPTPTRLRHNPYSPFRLRATSDLNGQQNKGLCLIASCDLAKDTEITLNYSSDSHITIADAPILFGEGVI